MVYPRYLESNASLRTEDIFIHFDAEFIYLHIYLLLSIIYSFWYILQNI